MRSDGGYTIIEKRVYMYKEVIARAVLFGAETCDVTSAKRKRVNVFEIKSLRSLAGVTQMD